MATATANAAFSSPSFLPSVPSSRALGPRCFAYFPTPPLTPCVLVARSRPSFPPTSLSSVAVSSEVELEDEGRRDGEVSFSPDLRLFVGNLPYSVDSAELAGLFVSAGTVEMVEVIYDKSTGKSRGFGFVTMSTAEEAEAAAQQFNGYELGGRPLRVSSGPPPRPPPRRDGPSSTGFHTGNRVFVGNLSWGVDNLALETFFSERGKVLEARVVYDRDSGRSRGFGFVTFSSTEEANSAIASFNGVDLDGRTIRVTMAEGRPPRRLFDEQ